MALKLGIQTYQILTNDDEVCIPSLSSILLAVIFVGESCLISSDPRVFKLIQGFTEIIRSCFVEKFYL
jgi:hypothetical protein